MSDAKDMGKKVFFLYPHSVIQEELIQHISLHEFEVYLVNDHVRLVRVLANYPNSILFVNIDERLKEEEWEKYISSLMKNEKTAGVQIGILTYNEDRELAQKYLMDLMVTGGYIQLKLGLKESTRIILQTLVANEARGKRRFVRATCPGNVTTAFNVEIMGHMYNGYIKDISTAGMACTFESDLDLAAKTTLDRIQLKLRSRIVMVSGVIAGKRKTPDSLIYVVIFTQYISGDAKQRISDFVYRILQTEMKKELEGLSK
jgi:hypothetical protein